MTGRDVPPEVVVDEHGRQVLALTDDGLRYSRYVECSAGCGWLIGCGDAIDQVSHESCAERRREHDEPVTIMPFDSAVADSDLTPERYFVGDFETLMCEFGARALILEVEENDGYGGPAWEWLEGCDGTIEDALDLLADMLDDECYLPWENVVPDPRYL